MKISKGFIVFCTLITSVFVISMELSPSPIEQIFAQSGDTNVIGQESGENDASQSSKYSQETDQNNQCVSGDSNFFSCNNGSSNNIGTNEQRTQGIEFPVIISNDNIYVRDGNLDTAIGPDTALSTVACDPGDALISGSSNFDLSDGSTIKSINHFYRHLGFSWNVQGTAQDNGEITVIAKILCYNNPSQ
jgi:hypothetical protein